MPNGKLAYTFFKEVQDWCIEEGDHGFIVQAYEQPADKREREKVREAFLKTCGENPKWFGPAFSNAGHWNASFTSKNRKFCVLLCDGRGGEIGWLMWMQFMNCLRRRSRRSASCRRGYR
jgi:hypothetical protein